MKEHFVEAEELQAYLDRELSPERRAEIQGHLSACPECANLLADLQRVSATLQSWQVEAAPESLYPPAVEATSKNRWTWPRWQFTLAGTAAVAIIVGTVIISNWPASYKTPPLGVEAPEAVVQQATDELAPPGGKSEPQKAQPPVAATQASQADKPAVALEEKASALTKTAPAKEKDEQPTFEEKTVAALDGQPAETRPSQEPAAPGVRSDAAAQAGTQKTAPQSSVDTFVVPREGRVQTQTESSRMARRRAAAPQVVETALAPSGFALADRRVASRVTLQIEVKKLDEARPSLDRTIQEAGGYVVQASSTEIPEQPRRAQLTLRVPAGKLDAVLEQVRKLGRVVDEQLSAEEVAEQVVDLEARLRNTRATENRLLGVLEDRTGEVKDVLEMEREIARTRTEIERMEAQRQNLLDRVEMATIQLTLLEEYQAKLEPAPVGTAGQLRNAVIEGYSRLVNSLVGLFLFVARYGPSLLLWLALLWATWRLVRTRLSGLFDHADTPAR